MRDARSFNHVIASLSPFWKRWLVWYSLGIQGSPAAQGELTSSLARLLAGFRAILFFGGRTQRGSPARNSSRRSRSATSLPWSVWAGLASLEEMVCGVVAAAIGLRDLGAAPQHLAVRCHRQGPATSSPSAPRTLRAYFRAVSQNALC